MALTVLIGGARSGKSATASALAHQIGRPVTYIATATAGDDEMAERIDRHRTERPAGWVTIEEPTRLEARLAGIDEHDTIIIDCLTLWLTNMMGTGADEPDILKAARAIASAAAGRRGETIAVTNEVGLGLVPPNPLGRQFRDLAGRVNRCFVDESHRTCLVVAGRVLPLLELSDWEDPRDDH
ncbi:MAG: bifunctional adenosylcobinamide kinase/adenosylcobinamide-phosphate guanylyltransferase [Acidimicrobiia bacterium]|nr:bifunctional adenosylcobinamide kinase/adenosylcobinamide-phosphate guanylyltransferase [Acidimicrobiia bacterium]